MGIIASMIITGKREQLQGYASNIIYIHVSMSWISIMGYMAITILSIIYIISKQPRIKEIYRGILENIIITTTISIITGILWAKPTWNTYLTIDIRIISMIILWITLIILRNMKNPYIMTIIGSINIIIIKYVVNWYNTMHQKVSIATIETKAHISIVVPIIIVTIGIIWVIWATIIEKEKIRKYKRWQ